MLWDFVESKESPGSVFFGQINDHRISLSRKKELATVQRNILNAEIRAHYHGGSADVIRKNWKEVRKIEQYVGHVEELQSNTADTESVKKVEVIELFEAVEVATPVREKSLRLRGGGPKQRKSTVRDSKVAENEEKSLVLK
jgi:hypothetical protein